MLRYPSSVLFINVLLLRVASALWTDYPVITWVFLEISLITIIPFISSRPAVRYFVIQALRSLLFFVGVLAMDVQIFFWLSISLKLGAAPTHWWVPMIYQEIRWPIIFMLSIIIKVVPLSIIDIGGRVESILYTLVITRLIVGAVGGLRQTSLKKLLAYSGINHIGWLMRTLLVSPTTWVFYLRLYALSIGFLLIRNLGGLSAYLILLSLGGLPPLLGFFPKLMVLNIMWVISPVVVGVIVYSAIISLFYYLLRIIAHLISSTTSWHELTPLWWFLGTPVIIIPTLQLWGSFNVTGMY